jgi:hypothetical protein
MSKESVDEAYAAGAEAAKNGEDGVCHADGAEYEAFKAGYYHTQGQIDANEGRNRSFSLSDWGEGNSKQDNANLESYREGLTADSRGSDPWWKFW